MERPGDIFHVCRRYTPDRAIVPTDHEATADCVTCAHQYAERACPIFRARCMRALGPEHIERFLRAMRLENADPPPEREV